MSWRLREHTADVILELDATTTEQLAQAAADGARHLMVGDAQVARREERRVTVDANEDGERFFRFLRELFYLYDVEGFLPASATADGEGWCVRGELAEEGRHPPRYHVKALARHGWRYERDEQGLHVRALLDL